MDGYGLARAVKHPGNYKPIIFCSVSLIGIGLLMVVLGIVLLLLDHIELGPPVYDPEYERHEGTSLATVMGKYSSLQSLFDVSKQQPNFPSSPIQQVQCLLLSVVSSSWATS